MKLLQTPKTMQRDREIQHEIEDRNNRHYHHIYLLQKYQGSTCPICKSSNTSLLRSNFCDSSEFQCNDCHTQWRTDHWEVQTLDNIGVVFALMAIVGFMTFCTMLMSFTTKISALIGLGVFLSPILIYGLCLFVQYIHILWKYACLSRKDPYDRSVAYKLKLKKEIRR